MRSNSYGYFDSSAREYVVTRPDTPAPWANYLGSPEYGAIITNQAGGYSFAKSGAAGRILRYRFNEEDKPGRYIYLRDDTDSEYWSVSWQPVAKAVRDENNPKGAAYECRHGLGYTTLSCDYKGIFAKADYYVPIGADYELWRVTITNNGDRPRDISVFGYAEFTCDGNYEQDQVNLQYTQYITRTYYEETEGGAYIRQSINENCANAVNGNAAASRVFGLSGALAASYSGDKAEFLNGGGFFGGAVGGYANPVGVANGNCGGNLNCGGNPCGALHTKLALMPKESKTFTFILGQMESESAAIRIERYADKSVSSADNEFAEIKRHWLGKLEALQVNTPDEDFNEMINTWNAYQCHITFTWSRAASLMYCGLRNGLGYRDTVQDIQGIIHLAPEAAKEKLIHMLSAQARHGGALPLVKFNHNAGHENTPEDPEYVKETGHPSYRADDALWLFPTVWKYIAETGDSGFLDERVLYADGGDDNPDNLSVYTHLLRAIEFSLNNIVDEDLPAAGLPAGLHADWNDCLRLGKNGASVFVAFQLYMAFDIMGRFADYRRDEETVSRMVKLSSKLSQTIEAKAWDSDRFVRGISEKGDVVGAGDNKEASFWLNPQSWAVISRYVDKERGQRIMDLVREKLNTPYGVKLMTPPFKQYPFDGALALLFNPGMKENGGIFLQPQGWAILAEALLGRGDNAYVYYKESCPAAYNDLELSYLRKLEPYAYGQFTESDDSPHRGRSHVHWLTGTASTVMVGCVEGILGLRPDISGLYITPAIPEDWDGFTMVKRFRGHNINIIVKREAGIAKPSLTLNGQALDNCYIPENMLGAANEAVILL